MKRVKNFLYVVCFLTVSGSMFAADALPLIKPESAQIQTILKSIDFDKYISDETKLNISFFINAQNEIIVVSTNSQDLDSVVKSTLNYKRIAVNELEYNKVYTVPVVIK